MNPMALSAVLSAGAGASLGLLGGGGSILTVPILLYSAHLAPKPAITLSLLVVGATSAAAAIPHARAGNVHGRTAVAFGVASMIGAVIGARLSHHLPSSALLAGFTLMMLVTGVAMLRNRPGSRALGNADANGPEPGRSQSVVRMAAYGVGVGVLTGLVGAGGGFVIVPALVLFGGLPIAAAIGTSLVIIALNSLTAFAAHVGSVPIDVQWAAVLTASSVVGSLVGAMLVRRIKPRNLRAGFAVLVLTIAGIMVVRQIRLSSRLHPQAPTVSVSALKSLLPSRA